MKKSTTSVPTLESIGVLSMDILGLPSRTTSWKQHVIVIIDKYFKLPCATLTAKTTATHAAKVFIDHRVVPYNFAIYLFTDKNSQFGNKFFLKNARNLKSNNWPPRLIIYKKMPSERCSMKLVTHLRLYLPELQKMKNLCPATHPCVLYLGSLLNQHCAIQIWFKQAAAKSSTVFC